MKVHKEIYPLYQRKNTGCLGWVIVIVVLIGVGCMSCAGKAEVIEDFQQLNKYQLFVDVYSKDTTVLGHRTLWWQARLTKSRNGGADTIADFIGLDCDRDSILHFYYVQNDKKIHPGIFPKAKTTPLFIDTNFINYTK
jgi:hypothetical protein